MPKNLGYFNKHAFNMMPNPMQMQMPNQNFMVPIQNRLIPSMTPIDPSSRRNFFGEQLFEKVSANPNLAAYSE
jgi:hypothetical protein